MDASLDTGFEAANARILERFHSWLTPELMGRSRAHITTALTASGVNQEGNPIPVSPVPTVLVEPEVEAMAAQGSLIRQALIELIEAFVEEHRAGHTDGPLHQVFSPYAKWWDLIAAEVRHTDPIQLMRYDTVREADGSWRILEFNTCCPAGVVHCGMVRRAWLQSPLGRAALGDDEPVRYPVDDPYAFVRHLIQTARSSSGAEAPNIAICSYQGVYRNELATIQRLHGALQDASDDPTGQLILGDIGDIDVTPDGRVRLRGTPVDLIYNKLDPITVDPQDPAMAGWVAAARSPRVEFLNSLAAMYLTEAKRSLAVLHDESTRGLLPGGSVASPSIERHIPWSRCLPDAQATRAEPATMDPETLALLWLNRHRYVLKPDSSTRGEGIVIGANLSPDQWLMAIVRAIGHNGIVQELVATPTRHGYREAGGSPNGVPADREYWGVDLMYYGAEFAGPVSRSHHQIIFNVGAGGSESPTIVLRSTAPGHDGDGR